MLVYMIFVLQQRFPFLNEHLSFSGLSLLVRSPVLLVQYAHHRTDAAEEADTQVLGELVQAGFDII